MTNERRRSPRVKVNLQARWEGVLSQQEATITDLSKTGCFVLTGGKVEPKELVRLEIEAPEGEPFVLWAEVVEAASVSFESLRAFEWALRTGLRSSLLGLCSMLSAFHLAAPMTLLISTLSVELASL